MDLRSVETFDGNAWKSQEIKNLPIFAFEHCIVKINSSTLLSIGGQHGNNYLSSTFFYNAQFNKWEPGPILRNSRSALSCSMLTWINPDSNQLQKIVVAAGGTKCDCRPSVELLFLNSDDSPRGGWERGPELPTPGINFTNMFTLAYFDSETYLLLTSISTTEKHNNVTLLFEITRMYAQLLYLKLYP